MTLRVSTLLVLLLLAALSGAATAQESTLNIYNWADYIDPQIIDDFERLYDIEVNYDIYDSSEIVDTKLMTGSSGYDLVLHSASFAARLSPIGVFAAVDRSKLTNWHHLDPYLIETVEENYKQPMIGVPYMWGTTGITYNVDMIRERMPNAPVDSMAMIFDPKVVSKFADCGVTFLDDPTTVIPFAMLYLGYPAGSVDTEHLKAVEALLKGVRPYIKYFSSTKMLLDMPSKEVCVSMSWSGDYAVASARAKEAGLDIDLAYSIPKEGSINWFDVFFMPSDAPHPKAAHLFLDYILRPEVIASASNYVGYANANKSATPLVHESITSDIGIYPDEETKKRLVPTIVLGPKLERLRSRTWTKVKTGL
ncbi:MAG: putrescine transport system substrate-binding protein [Halioglobus sp.]